MTITEGSLSKKLLLTTSVAIILFGAAACGESADDESGGNGGGSSSEETSEEGGEQENAAPGPDLEGIPDVVAEVNGEEIGKDEFVSVYEGQFQQMAMQSQQTGQEVDQDQLKKQTAENLVNNKILIQEADNRGLSASEDEVDKTLTEIAQQQGLESKDEFLKMLDEQGMGEEEVMSQLEIQVKLDQLIAEETGDTDPTEEELQELYDRTAEQQEQMGAGEGSELPPFEDVKPQLKEQIKAEKENEAVQTLIDELREDADISINL